MPPVVAAAVCVIGVFGLFWLSRDQNARASFALWIPTFWFLIVCSRPVGMWLGSQPDALTAADLLDGSPVDRFVFIVLILAGLAVVFTRGRLVGRLLLANGPIILFYLYCASSILWSDYPEVSFKRWIKALGDLEMVIIVLTDSAPLSAFNRVLARLAYFLIPASIVLIKYFPQYGLVYFPWGGKPSIGGVTTNKNSLGAICLCLGLWVWWRFLSVYRGRKSSGRSRQLLAYAIVLAMVVWLFRSSNSMTSLNCFLMASLLITIAGFRLTMRRPAVLHALILVMLVVSSSVLFLDTSPDVLEFMGRNSTLTDRTEIWHAVLPLVKNPWFGTGYESFWLGPRLAAMWSQYWWHPQEAHNGYLEVYLNLGLVGIALLTVVLLVGYRTVIKAWRGGAPEGRLMLAYFFAALVYNFTEAAFFKIQAVTWIFCLFAIVVAPEFSLGRSPAPSAEISNTSGRLSDVRVPSAMNHRAI